MVKKILVPVENLQILRPLCYVNTPQKYTQIKSKNLKLVFFFTPKGWLKNEKIDFQKKDHFFFF